MPVRVAARRARPACSYRAALRAPGASIDQNVRTSTTAAGRRCSRSRCSSSTSSPALVAARAAPDAPLSNGIVAGVGAFVLWIPLRILIWVDPRHESQGLFSGTGPGVHRRRSILGQLVFAAAFGAHRRLDRRPRSRLRRRRRAPVDRTSTERARGGSPTRAGSRCDDARGGGEPAGWSRTGFDPSEERPDSTGQGAG